MKKMFLGLLVSFLFLMQLFGSATQVDAGVYRTTCKVGIYSKSGSGSYYSLQYVTAEIGDVLRFYRGTTLVDSVTVSSSCPEDMTERVRIGGYDNLSIKLNGDYLYQDIGYSWNEYYTMWGSKREYEDNTAPTATGLQNFSYILGEEANTTQYLEGVIVSDSIDDNPTITVDDSQVDYSVLGSHPLIFTTSDQYGNTRDYTKYVYIRLAEMEIQTDTTSISYTIGETPLTSGDIITETNLTANDPNSELNPTITCNTSTIHFDRAGTYNVTCTVTGETIQETTPSTTQRISVTVLDDVAPSITIKTEDIILTVGDVITDHIPSCLVQDNSTEVLSCDIDYTNVNSMVIGEYQLLVNAEDASGNNADQIIIKVYVYEEDTESPVITVNENVKLVFEVGDAQENWLSYFSISDNRDGNIPVTADIVLDSNYINLNVPGSYTLTAVVKDSSGNIAVKSLIIIVNETLLPEDNTAPVITINTSAKFSFEVGDSQENWLNYFSVIDDHDGQITITSDMMTGIEQLDLTTPGNYTLTLVATDSSGNTSVKTITVSVEDTSIINQPIDETPTDNSTGCGSSLSLSSSITGLFIAVSGTGLYTLRKRK